MPAYVWIEDGYAVVMGVDVELLSMVIAGKRKKFEPPIKLQAGERLALCESPVIRVRAE